MRELAFDIGGRKLFNEDLSDLQEQIRAAESLFLGEDPFVISGMIFTGSTGAYNISEGYVWLGNKIRRFDGIASFDEISTTTHLLSENLSEETEYDDNIDRQSTISYGYRLESNLNTSGIPSSELLRIDNISNIRRYFDNVLGDKYVLKDSGQTQEILNNLSLNLATISSNANISTQALLSAASIYVTNGELKVMNGNLRVEIGSIYASNGIVGDEFYTINGGGASILSDGIIGADKVVTNSIANGAVETIKIDNLAVTSVKIAEDAVITSKILDGNVTYGKLSTDTQNSFSQVSYLGGGSFTQLKTHIQEIGGYDMTGAQNKSVNLTNFPAEAIQTITSVSVVILSDIIGGGTYPFSQATKYSSAANLAAGYNPDGTIEVVRQDVAGGAPLTNIYIESATGSRFDNTDFNATNINRGYITITYLQ